MVLCGFRPFRTCTVLPPVPVLPFLSFDVTYTATPPSWILVTYSRRLHRQYKSNICGTFEDGYNALVQRWHPIRRPATVAFISVASGHDGGRLYTCLHVMDIQIDLWCHPTFVYGHLVELLQIYRSLGNQTDRTSSGLAPGKPKVVS